MIRYSDLVTGGIFFYISFGMLLVILSRSNVLIHSNIPLLSVLLANFLTGGQFGNFFCEKRNEMQSYMLAPWSARAVILSKNYVLIFLALLFPLPIIIAVSFFIHSNLHDYMSAILYEITVIPTCMLIGTMMSISRGILSSTRNVLPFQLLLVVVSILPYAIFEIWFHSTTLCILFLCVSVIVWYVYELPVIERNFRDNLLKTS